MKKPLLLLLPFIIVSICSFSQTNVDAGRMNEVFRKTDLVNAAANLNDPWEITYGPDDSLWITEAKGYRVRKVHPVNGGMRTILDLTTFALPWRKNYTSGGSVPNPQGGLMGLAIAPDYMTAAQKYVYVAYIHDFIGTNVAYNGETVNGDLFITWLVRFTYANGQLANPLAICDTIRGSSDHNSGRMIIAKEAGTSYLYYAVGDMGAGQFANTNRVIKAQWTNSYEGKILRFNLNGTIPASNPYGAGSAVWATGMRNNQGLAFDTTSNILYGSSHGPFSDDEVNILQLGKNYGHPLVEGYSDDNYNNSKAATPASILPLIVDETNNASTIGASYQDPLFAAYAALPGNSTTPGTVNYIYNNNPANGAWPSEGWSGLGLYTDSKIPGWKNSLIAASLKWGRLVKLRLNPAGTAVVPTGTQDTVSYFGSRNRFRDVAFDPDGKTIYVVMDRSTTSSGPSNGSPIVPDCLGCIHKYTFLGYNDNAGL
ncbi:MAG: PQQ-dependent sugar dehydrogenase, partial [Chitinophagaceae bacterium]